MKCKGDQKWFCNARPSSTTATGREGTESQFKDRNTMDVAVSDTTDNVKAKTQYLKGIGTTGAEHLLAVSPATWAPGDAGTINPVYLNKGIQHVGKAGLSIGDRVTGP